MLPLRTKPGTDLSIYQCNHIRKPNEKNKTWDRWNWHLHHSMFTCHLKYSPLNRQTFQNSRPCSSKEYILTSDTIGNNGYKNTSIEADSSSRNIQLQKHKTACACIRGLVGVGTGVHVRAHTSTDTIGSNSIQMWVFPTYPLACHILPEAPPLSIVSFDS